MADALDKKPPQILDKIGSKVSKSPLLAHAVQAPPAEVAHDGIKDAERLKQLAQLHKRIESAYFDQMQQKLNVLAATPARRLGFGAWRKKYPNEEALLAALEANILPVFEKLWDVSLASANELTGEPPLHPVYVADEPMFAMEVKHDDCKHVAHAYAMSLAHIYFRNQLEEKRRQGVVRVPSELMYLLEVNFCQYYVPQGLAAYFEAQPLRALMREVGNRFRKVAFGGQ